MFATKGHFGSVLCPEIGQCQRVNCVFSHNPSAQPTKVPRLPVLSAPAASSNTLNNSPPRAEGSNAVTKRASFLSAQSPSPTRPVTPNEPARKLQKVDIVRKIPTASTSHLANGVPILSVNAAQSRVPVPVRQAMLKALYLQFQALYSDILPANPTLASEHALAQEQEVYAQSTKLTYRNAVIATQAAIVKRQKPTSISHDSVGTEDALKSRREQRNSIQGLRLTREHLIPFIMSVETMREWGYIVEAPEGPGGDKPNDIGLHRICDRCRQPFVVKKREEADICVYHPGRPYVSRIDGERVKVYKCCSRTGAEGEGCERGVHVFADSDPQWLHARFPFSHTRPPFPADSEKAETALDVVALDCEMIYTTGGSRIARVSVVDGTGREIFDEFVKMDEGVEVLDYNTRFSGVTEAHLADAVLSLASVRRSLDAFINSETILIGHGLENDLNTLRMLHHRCVDTAILYPHKNGKPYRRALRDLTREHLDRQIQTGDATTGHSSVEDSIATLDLVRLHVLKGGNKPATATVTPSASTSAFGSPGLFLL